MRSLLVLSVSVRVYYRITVHLSVLYPYLYQRYARTRTHPTRVSVPVLRPYPYPLHGHRRILYCDKYINENFLNYGSFLSYDNSSFTVLEFYVTLNSKLAKLDNMWCDWWTKYLLRTLAVRSIAPVSVVMVHVTMQTMLTAMGEHSCSLHLLTFPAQVLTVSSASAPSPHFMSWTSSQ